MKKIFIFIIICFSLLVTISCSKDDEDSSSSSFNPPSWIIGTWLDKTEPEWSQMGGFKFTNNNIIDLDATGNEILNYDESFKATLITGITKIEEEISDDTYQVKITTSGVTSINYKYHKGSSNTIIYELSATHNIVLTKQ